MNAETIVSKLEGAIHRGGRRWYARCPAHDDRAPSLSVREAEDGKILIHCHAGCSPDAVLGALGLAWTDLYPDRWQAAERRAVATPPKRMKFDPLEVERWTLRIAAEQVRRGEALSLEDNARVQVARLRLAAAKEVEV